MLLSNLDLLATAPGGVARLRELILTLAVQGKLVPQDPADEPASVLLQKIRAEKDRLIAEGKIRKDKPLAAIAEDEKPFKLPQGWEWVRLLDLLPDFQNGASSRGDAGGRSITVLRLADIKNRRISLIDTREISIAEGDIKKHQLLPGDILVTRVNGSADMVGQFNLCDIPVNAIYCDHFIRLRLSDQWMDSKYLALLGESALVRERIKELFITTAGQKTVNQGHISSLQFGLPPLAEQSRIVTRVESLMRLCDALEAKGQLEATQHAQLVSTLLGTLTTSATPKELAAHWQRVAQHFDLLLDRPEAIDALEQTLLQLAVRGLLVPQNPTGEPASVLLQKIRTEKDRLIAEGKIKRDKPLPPIADEEKPFELPVGWEWVRINDLAEVQGGIQKTQLRRPIQQHFPYLRVANVQRDALLLKEIKRFELTLDELEKWRLITGDLLIVEGNGSADEIGRCAVWDGSIDPCVYQNHLIRMRCFQQATMVFAKLFLNSPSGMDEMKHLAITTSGLYSLSVGKIRNFAIPLPPLAEQSRIVVRVTELRRLCANLRQRLAERQSVQARLAEALVTNNLQTSSPYKDASHAA